MMNTQTTRDGQTQKAPPDLLTTLQARLRAAQEVRRGVCLLNAGRFAEAATVFHQAAAAGCTDQSLPSYLAACLTAQGKPAEAAAELAEAVGDRTDDASIRIRHALALWASGKSEEAIEALRAGIAAQPECAELHFQLGTMLTRLERYEEAELRFTQAVNIDRHHAEALVSLGLCCALRGRAGDAVTHLQRAQAMRPHDARIGLLLAQAAMAMQHQGLAVRIRAEIDSAQSVLNRRDVDELSRVIEADPDFVDAFLSIRLGEVDEEVFRVLLATLEMALERQPEQAELHYHCGRVLDRLGRREDAIEENERAVRINPRFTRALIELGRLYQETDREADATSRLEQAIAAGAEYADVYCLLGHLYRNQGETRRARQAYRRALTINHRYTAAREALATLSA